MDLKSFNFLDQLNLFKYMYFTNCANYLPDVFLFQLSVIFSQMKQNNQAFFKQEFIA